VLTKPKPHYHLRRKRKGGDWRGRSEGMNGWSCTLRVYYHYPQITIKLVAGRANTWCWVESTPLSALDTWTLGTVHATPRNFCNSGPAQPEVLMTSPLQPWLQLRVSKHHTHSQVSNLETPVFPARGRPMRLVGFEVVRLCGVVSLTSVPR
jgi:hypothetical protein